MACRRSHAGNTGSVSSEAIAADIKAIGDSGIFAQIAPVFTAVPEGVQLTYQVATNPVVNQVRVEGVSAFDAEYLAQMLAIPQGSVLNTVEVGENRVTFWPPFPMCRSRRTER